MESKRSGWLSWHFLRWKGADVPDYYIDETGPEPVFYCDHDCGSLAEHEALTQWRYRPTAS